MPLIIDGAFVADAWIRITADTHVPADRDVIVPWSHLPTLKGTRLPPAHDPGAAPNRLGVEVGNDISIAALAPFLGCVALIAVSFPSAADGRGFSLARQLRAAGFHGELRASGPLIADQYGFALACGFDSVEIPAALALRQPQAQWQRAARAFEHGYQVGYREGRSILQLRHEARPSAGTGHRLHPAAAVPPSVPPNVQQASPQAWAAHW